MTECVALVDFAHVSTKCGLNISSNDQPYVPCARLPLLAPPTWMTGVVLMEFGPLVAERLT